jgi:hypothetical protein
MERKISHIQTGFPSQSTNINPNSIKYYSSRPPMTEASQREKIGIARGHGLSATLSKMASPSPLERRMGQQVKRLTTAAKPMITRRPAPPVIPVAPLSAASLQLILEFLARSADHLR